MSSNGTKFTVLPKSCISIYGESIGIAHLDDDIADSMSQDVTYRVREAIQVKTDIIIYFINIRVLSVIKVFSSSEYQIFELFKITFVLKTRN